jgi:hypothetical protein
MLLEIIAILLLALFHMLSRSVFVIIMGRSQGRKWSSKSIPVTNTPLCGNFSLFNLRTNEIYHNPTPLGFLDSPRNLVLLDPRTYRYL